MLANDILLVATRAECEAALLRLGSSPTATLLAAHLIAFVDELESGHRGCRLVPCTSCDRVRAFNVAPDRRSAEVASATA
jgi:hypothetical protein